MRALVTDLFIYKCCVIVEMLWYIMKNYFQHWVILLISVYLVWLCYLSDTVFGRFKVDQKPYITNGSLVAHAVCIHQDFLFLNIDMCQFIFAVFQKPVLSPHMTFSSRWRNKFSKTINVERKTNKITRLKISLPSLQIYCKSVKVSFYFPFFVTNKELIISIFFSYDCVSSCTRSNSTFFPATKIIF